MEQWRQDQPNVDLAAFRITATHVGPADAGPHEIREAAICKAVEAALGLPKAIRVSADAAYATLSYCSGGGPDATDYRIRINGFAFGKGSHKATEYLSISVLGMTGGEIVEWSEDVQKLGGTAKGWADFHAGKYPGRSNPPPTKGSPKDCALLTFVDENEAPLKITKQLRALVAAVAPAPAATPPKAKQPAKKRAPKRRAAK